MKQIPCKDCITFPICKTEVHDFGVVGWLQHLLGKCSLIKKYLKANRYITNIEHLQELQVIMETKKLEWK